MGSLTKVLHFLPEGEVLCLSVDHCLDFQNTASITSFNASGVKAGLHLTMSNEVETTTINNQPEQQAAPKAPVSKKEKKKGKPFIYMPTV